MTANQADLKVAYEAHEQRIAIGRIRIGCVLAMVLLPLGALVDRILYDLSLDRPALLMIRLGGALLMLPFLVLVNTQIGARHHRSLGVLLAMIPAASMAWIVHRTDGASSPYYASLNLVLLAISLVLQWTVVQSVVAVTLVVLMYLWAAVPTIAGNPGIFVNNLWFLVLTGVIVVTGNRVQSQLRYNDFASRHELDRSRSELEASNQRLRELDEVKGRFFANISHELRTPLTLMLGPLESLRQNPALVADARMAESLSTMQANGMRLLKLINDLLDLVRLDAGRLQLHCTALEVESFLGGVVTAVRRFAEDRGLEVVTRVAPDLTHVFADPDKLEKVLLNLLFNSIKFTQAGGQVRVDVLADGAEAIFEVTDNGVGISEENQQFLFSRFWQADSSTQRKFQGVGIGLALVKELVEAHGGTVSVRSQLGKGTTFALRLPLPTELAATTAAAKPVGSAGPAAMPVAKPEPGQPAVPPSAKDAWLSSLYRRAELFASITPLRKGLRPWTAGPNSRRPRVLIADDEPDMLRFLRTQIEEDYEVVEAVDGNQAATLAAQYMPDAVVCDMMMPEKDGLEVCRELRSNLSTESLPFLMLTARADDETKLQALGSGASDFLCKPFSIAELRLRIKNLVDGHQMQKALAGQNRKLEATLEQLKDTELQLVQSEKLASLGRMSAGIMHEINNPLNFAKTGLFTLDRYGGRLPEDAREEFHDTLKDITEGITRVGGIIADLRTYTHPQGGVLDDVEVSSIVTAALRFLSGEWKDRVEMQNEVPEGFTVRAASGRLMQVLVNLLQNSIDALKTAQPARERPVIRLQTAEANGHRFIRIWDNGMGIPSHHLSKIFDPFFTTKDVGQGTGLGLSICYRIVHDFGGRITVRSAEGQFCEFTLEFPNEVEEN